MRHIVDEKNIDSSIDFITEIEDYYPLVIKGAHTQYHLFLGSMHKEESACFKIEIQTTSREFVVMKDISSVILETPKYNLNVNKILINSIGNSIVKGQVNEFSVNQIKVDEKKYFRIIIKRNKNLSFHFFFDYFYPYQKGIFRSREQLKVTVDNNNFDIYLYPIKNVQYLIIDSHKELSHECFNRSVYSIALAYGFITGSFPMDEGYYFASSDAGHKSTDFIKYSRFIDSIESPYHPIYTNAYGYLDDKKKAEALNKKLKGISRDVFSNLCTKAYKSKEFSQALYTLLEGSRGSIQMMAWSYSICLETLTSIIAEENHDRLNPIKSKSIAKKIHKELLSVIDSNKPDLINAYEILEKRINDMNKPTNRDKLQKPFEILKIKLTSDDVDCIDKRNDFLHGRRPNIEKASEEEFGMLYHIALKLAVLNSALILKSCGFSGKILNHPQIQSSITKVNLHEEIYRDI
jgi:hypothetical protein